MPKIEIPFTGPTYESESPFIASQKCINFYLRPYPEAGENKFALFGTPGLVEWCDLGTDEAVSALVTFGNFLYAESGGELFRVDNGGTATSMGSTGPVRNVSGMATNGVDVTVVKGETGYVHVIGETTTSLITDADFPGGDSIIHIDGYYLVNRPDTGQIFRSDLNSGSSWDGLAFSTEGGDPDNTLSLVDRGRDVHIFGERSSSIWRNTGTGSFNFARIEGSFQDQGTVSNFSTTRINNAVYWVGRDEDGLGQVFQSANRQSTVISPFHITRSIAQERQLSDVHLFSYQQSGHSFVVVQLPGEDKTFVFDTVTNLWHERSSILGTRRIDGQWRVNCHTYFNGDNIVGDYTNGKLYKLRTDVYDEVGTDMISVRSAPILRRNQSPITINEVQVIIEPGVGLITGNSEDITPQALFSWSTDGGRTWSPEVDIPMGTIGGYENKCVLTQLGQGENWVIEYKVSAAVKRVVLGAVAEVEQDDD